MITGIGTDIVKIERFEKLSGRFFERVFTGREREFLAGKNAESAAGLFAAKEAVAKALGTGFSGFEPCDVEILHEKSGKPYVILHGNASAAREGVTVHVSISHTKTDAVAYAVAEL